jgi:hypothetical protein
MSHIRKFVRWSLTAAITLALGGAVTLSVQAQTAGKSLGATGTIWGGEHVELEVTTEGVTLEFDCASGTIAQPLTVDSRGNFKVKGTFTRERPGPVMRDSNQTAAATYSGNLTGDTLRLTITAGPQSEGVGEYVLTRGKPGQVMKCK